MASDKVECRRRLVQAIAVVEATTYERLMLRSQWGKIYSWEDDGSVHTLSMGTLDGRDITVEFSYATVDGYKIGFWHSVGPVLDRELVRTWTKARMVEDGFVTNAIDFGNVIGRIAARKKKAK